MKTTIVPQIKRIDLFEKPLSLKNFFLSEEILQRLPIAKDIFKNNKKDKKLYPIACSHAEMDFESYKIQARANKIEITFNTNRGLMYALFTLSELSLLNNDKLVEFDVDDTPALNFRASSDDISRGQISTTQDFFEIIKKLARYKYNTYMPYIEDIFKFNTVEGWGKYSDPVEKEEWKQIIRFAKQYQMDIRPILNLLGHFDKGAYIEELQPLALVRQNGEVSHVMDPKKSIVRDVICNILDEVVGVFGKGVIHAGGDEPVDLTDVYGVKKGGQLFIEHYTFIYNELQKRSCSHMMYADFFAPAWGDYAVPVDRAKELPEKTEFVFWDYGVRPEYPFIDALHNQGIKMYISPGSWTWKRFSCDIKTCYYNTKGLLEADNGRSLGMIMSSWADGGDTLREFVWPGVFIGANYCWAPNSTYSYEEIYNLYHSSFFGFDENQAALLDNIYHQDWLIKRKHEHEFKEQMFKNPDSLVDFEDKENINNVIVALLKAREDIKTLTPKRNEDAFNALELSIEAALFTARKIAILPHEKPKTIEQASKYSEPIADLAHDLLKVKDLHKKLWFKNNRYSEWDICQAKYDDLYDQLRMLARNIKLRKYFKNF